MRVLMLSGGAAMLDASSAVAKRMIEYGRTFGELDILLLLGEREKKGVTRMSHVTIYPVYGKFSRFWKGYALGKKLMQQARYDVITAQDAERALIAWLLSRKFKVPWQMQIHADIFSPHFARHSLYDRARARLAKFLVPRAHGVRVVSERIKESILALGILDEQRATSNITVLPIFLDAAKIRNAPIQTDLREKYPGRFIILAPCRLTKEKNVGMAVEAMRRLVADGKAGNALLLIVGRGPERDALERQVKSGNLRAHVIFEDWTDDMPSYYKTADVYLLTSVYEGGARSPLEALAAGLPVVMTDVAPAKEDIIDGHNGIVVPVGDSKELARQLGELISSKEKLAKLKKGAAASLRSPISKEDYLALYKKLLTDLL